MKKWRRPKRSPQAKADIARGILYPAYDAMMRVPKLAREVAKKHGTPVYYMKDGKIIEEWP